MGFIRNFNIEIVDGLDSTSPDSALSSNQGKILDAKITNVSTEVNNAINGVNEKVDNFVQRVDTECVKSRDTIIGEEITIDNRDLHTIVGKLEEDLNDVKPRLEQAESKNIEQDNRLKDVENRNRVQDVYLNGLFNENNDGRLSVEGEGNDLKLESSKEGLVTVDKVVGNTFVNNVVKLTPPTMSDNTSFEKIERTEYENYIEYKLINALDTTTGAIIDWLAKVQYPLKDNNVYTLVVPNTPQTSDFSYYNIHSNGVSYRTQDTSSVFVFTPINWNSNGYFYFYCFMNTYNIGDTITVRFPKHIMILEGDYTNKPIPSEYIEGLQSSFEENLVTEEMVNEGLESEENLGKYKVPIKLVGKNKFDTKIISALDGVSKVIQDSKNCITFSKNLTDIKVTNCKFKLNTQYTIKYSLKWVVINNEIPSTARGQVFKIIYTDGTTTDASLNGTIKNGWTEFTIISSSNKTISHIQLTYGYGVSSVTTYIDVDSIQLEEGIVATDNEKYFERTTNIYLSSPLLKNDEIVMHDGELCHYHKGLIDIWTGDESWGLMTTFEGNKFAISIKPYNESIDVLVGANTLKIEVCDKLKIDNPYMDNLNCVWIYRGSENGNVERRLALDGTQTTVDDYKNWLKENNLKIYYPLQNPYYEPIQSDKLLLECANNSTIHIDTVVPIQTINASYTSNIPSLTSMTKNIETLENTNIDILATAWDTDYRVCEIEWILESLIDSSTSISLTDNLRTRGVVTMALTRFEQAKIIINGDAYYRPIFQKQLERYLEKGYLTQEEFDILIAMMDEREKEKQ